MPSVSAAEWQDNRSHSATSYTPDDRTARILTAKVEGVDCFAVYRNGRVAGLLVGTRYSPLAILADYRAAVAVFSPLPTDLIDAIDEVLSLSGTR